MGFSLLEVLISVAILSIGLLGLARMQTLSLQNSQSAYYRTQATLLAYDIAERVRVNRDAADLYALAATGSPPSNPCGSSGTNGADSCSYSTKCAASGSCTPVDLAELDLFSWHRLVEETLPEGGATITHSGDTVTVSILWDQNRDGVAETGGTDSEVFEMNFVP